MEINLSALRENFRAIRAHVAPAKIMSVVKANAYGHGLTQCARVLAEEGSDYFGVAIVEEGVRLRRAGVSTPILIFGGIFTDQLGVYLDYDLDITASSVEKVRLIDATAAGRGVRARVHIKIDTGMGRIGVRPESAEKLIEETLRARHCELIGVFTHLATADERDQSFTREQLEKFLQVCSYFERRGLPMPQRHVANSAAVLGPPMSYLDMVRPGLALFGVTPAKHLCGVVPLQPVMKVSSRVVFFKVVTTGSTVSYGRTWKAERATRVVTIPVGYGDGYPRALSNRGEVLIRGKRYPIVGRVCMDQIMVSVGDDEAFNGDEVVLIGPQGDANISVEEVSESIGAIPYEILTALNLRIPRTFLEAGEIVGAEEAFF